jgi:NAD(P)-dependent dehydrogenase (short-subunit alcohol dehydrogenase family)
MARRWALVTAGAQGLGGAISRRLGALGYGVVVHYHRSAAGAEAIRAELAAAGVPAVLAQADLGVAADRERLARAVEVAAPSLDVLVHNLGVYPEVGLLETTLEQWESTFALTCTAVFHLTQLLIPALSARAEGDRLGRRVVMIGDSCIDRVEARAFATPYHVAKLGVHVLARSYAQLLTPRGITVNVVSPGFLENSVGTPGEPIPAGRLGTFEDITGAIDYLLSPAADYVSGAHLVVGGAWNLG